MRSILDSMRFRLSSLLKLVAACAFGLAFWRVAGWMGVVVVLAGLVLVVAPIVLIRIGRDFGDPILSGLFGGGLAWACWALVGTTFAPGRSTVNWHLVVVSLGMLYGGLYGFLVYCRDASLGRTRRGTRRLAYRYDLVLFLFLVAAVSAITLIDEIRWTVLPSPYLFNLSRGRPDRPSLSPHEEPSPCFPTCSNGSASVS